MANNALIYPYINLDDPVSLKKALLLYDNLYRIVPDSVIPEDADEVSRFIKDYEIIESISPTDYLEETAEKFCENLGHWEDKAWGFHNYTSEGSNSRLHEGKVYSKLRNRFIEQNILEYDGSWLKGNNFLLLSICFS